MKGIKTRGPETEETGKGSLEVEDAFRDKVNLCLPTTFQPPGLKQKQRILHTIVHVLIAFWPEQNAYAA